MSQDDIHRAPARRLVPERFEPRSGVPSEELELGGRRPPPPPPVRYLLVAYFLRDITVSGEEASSDDSCLFFDCFLFLLFP